MPSARSFCLYQCNIGVAEGYTRCERLQGSIECCFTNYPCHAHKIIFRPYQNHTFAELIIVPEPLLCRAIAASGPRDRNDRVPNHTCKLSMQRSILQIACYQHADREFSSGTAGPDVLACCREAPATA